MNILRRYGLPRLLMPSSLALPPVDHCPGTSPSHAELREVRLGHKEQAEQFYHDLKTHGVPVRIGMEASGHARWIERLLNELQFELWIGDAAAIRTKRVRKQKTDRQDAQLLLRLLLEDRFPKIWVPDAENRDLRQLLWHRHRLVQMRTRVMNQLHVVALNEGLRRKKALWRPAGRVELEGLSLAPWASRRRQDLLDLLDRLTPKIHELNGKLEQIVERRPVTRQLSTHPGVGPLTALAFELVIGTPKRFACAKQIASYVGGWCRRKSPAEIGAGWATSASRATCCCASCWWKPPRSRCAAIRGGAASFFSWPCAAVARSPR
jgi:transposase